MDLVIRLSKINIHNAILVIINYFFEYATFIPSRPNYKAEDVAELFLCHIMKLRGILPNIILDCDHHFMGISGQLSSPSLTLNFIFLLPFTHK